jgi:hypothetical protein
VRRILSEEFFFFNFGRGHTMSKELAKKGISTTLISDSAVFALMPRVNKVIIGNSRDFHLIMKELMQ